MKRYSYLTIALIVGSLAATAPAMAAPTRMALPSTGSQVGLTAPVDEPLDDDDRGSWDSALDGMNATYLHSNAHAAHHYRMTYGRHSAHVPGHNSHGTGSHRTTATGGNPGGFSSRN